MMNSRYVTGLSALIAVAYFAFSVSVLGHFGHYLISPYFTIPVALSIFMVPTGYARRSRNSKIADARKRVSDFLRDLSEYTMYGTPLSEAVLLVSKNDYGALNPEVRSLVSSVSVGTPVEEALRHFGDSLNDPEIQRFGIILQKSGESGSNTSDVIALVSRFSSQMQLLNEERNAEMKNYNLILLISFAVFLIVMLVIDVRFFDAIHLQNASGFLFQSAGPRVLKHIFNTGIYVEAAGIGFIIGLIRDRNLVTGFMETGAMLFASAIILLISGAI